MAPSQNIAVTILLTIYFRFITCNELYNINMVKDIHDHVQTNWIIAQTCSKTDYPIINLVKEIKKSMIVYMNIFEWRDFLTMADFGRRGTYKPLVLLTCWACPLDCLIPMTEMPQLINQFTWVLLKHENRSFNLNYINVPINSIFMVIEKTAPDLYLIREVYRLSANSDLIYAEFGMWSSKRGLNCTSISLEDRRSNFFGHKITTLMELQNSSNPLLHVNNHFVPCYVQMSRRLNFTIERIIKLEDYHEVSLILEWADSPSRKVPFLPIYSSRPSIFFKDTGIGIQLLGYITPFQIVVWQAMLFLVILAGVLSYISGNIYARMTRSKKLSQRMDFYLYKYFYILCQKSETEEKYAAHRIITISHWIISIFLLSCYSAIFISFISVEIPKPPFTTIDELLEKKGYNIVTSKYLSQSTLLFLETSGDPKLRKLYETHFHRGKNSVENAPKTFCEGSHYIFITSEVHMAILRSSPEYSFCPISKNKIGLHLRYLAWFIEKDSNYRRFLQVFITKANAAGLMQSYFVQKNIFRSAPQPPKFRNITLKDTTLLFIIIGTGFLISPSILFLELALKKFFKMNHKKFPTPNGLTTFQNSNVV